MAANTIDRGRLRRLADVRPERGRVLSVFLNLDPAQFGTAPARATAITSIVNDATRKVEECQRHDHGGWSQLRYERSVEKDKNDHLAHVADVLFTAYKRRGFDRLLIGGPEEILGDVERHLHSYLQKRVAGRLHLDGENSGIDDVRAAVAEEFERLEKPRPR